jgi:hypothetical protein
MTAVDVAIIVLASLSLVRVLTRTWTRQRGHRGRHTRAGSGRRNPARPRRPGREPEPGGGPSPGHAQPAATQDQRHHRNAGASHPSCWQIAVPAVICAIAGRAASCQPATRAARLTP